MTGAMRNSIPRGGKSTEARHSDPGAQHHCAAQDQSEGLGIPKPNQKCRDKVYIGTLNVNSMLKIGKQMELTKVMNEQNLKILAIQETRYRDEDAIQANHYRIYKGKPAEKIQNTKGLWMFGTAFVVHNSLVDKITEFKSTSPRMSTLTFKNKNKLYTLVNVHAPINKDNQQNPEKVERFWEGLEEMLGRVPEKNVVILLGDFNAQIGRNESSKVTGKFTAHSRTNMNGKRLIELCERFNLNIMTTKFQKKPKKQTTWRSPNKLLGEFQIDHVAITYSNSREIQDTQVAKGANFDSDHYLTKVKMKLTPERRKKNGRTSIVRYRIEELKLNQETLDEYKDRINMIQSHSWTDIAASIQDAAEKKHFKK